MSRNIYIFIILSIFFSSCSFTKRLEDSGQGKTGKDIKISEFCDSIKPFNNLYISKIRADFYLDEEKYDARMSLFYCPDSVVLISAVNAGFEIVRMAITPDSTVFINKLEKTAIIFKENSANFSAPVNFFDIENLFDKNSLCKLQDLKFENGSYILDRSSFDLKKIITYDAARLNVDNFEFFHKKTGEYIVGKRGEEKDYIIYTNFMIDNLEVEADGGIITYNKEFSLNWNVNREKYSIIYL